MKRKYLGVKCKTPGCDSNAKLKGYCLNCYARMNYRRRKKTNNS